MTSLLEQQQRLLVEKLRVLQRLDSGLHWSLERLSPLDSRAIDDPGVSERASAIVDRFCKPQDQFAGALRHAHGMLGEKYRSFHDVLVWAVSEQILEDETMRLELRSLRNRLTHEYDLASDRLPELLALVRRAANAASEVIRRFANLCEQRGLLLPA